MRSLTLLLLLVRFLPLHASGMDQEISDAARKLAIEYRKTNPEVLFKQSLVILPLKANVAELGDKNIEPAIRAQLRREFVRSLIFEVVEREELATILKEYELQQSGLTAGGKPVEPGALSTADLLLAGEILQQNGTLRIELRLISARSGKIMAAAGTVVTRDEAEIAGKQYYAAAFQSKYGITIALEPGMVFTQRYADTPMTLNSFSLGYRAYSFLRLGLGYSLFNSDEFAIDKLPANSTGKEGYRKYTMTMHGPKLTADFLLGLNPRFNLLLRTEAILFASARLQQEAVELQSYVPTGTAANTGEQQRVLVDAYTKYTQAMVRVGLGGEYLISQRISVMLLGGYLFHNTFTPSYFEAAGYRQWTDDIDKNGTFLAYDNFNFARRGDGTRVSFNFSGFYFIFGLSLHF